MAMIPALKDISTLDQLYRDCVIEVKGRGTAFLIDEHTALTCSHLFVDSIHWPEPPSTAVLLWNGIEGIAKVTCLRTRDTRNSPDVAFLEEIVWESDIPRLPFAMLFDDWEPGQHYFVWGHPTGDFAAESLVLSYSNSDALHILGPLYKKLSGPFYPAPGLSGSPVLNRKRGVVCGIAAISLNQNVAEGIAAVPISYVFQHRPDLVARLELLHRQWTRWWDLTPSGNIWKVARAKCHAILDAIPQFYKGADNRHYEPRQLESNIKQFLSADAAGMFVVGNSGMGKTTLLARFALENADTANLIFIIESSRLSPSLEALESELASRLGHKADLCTLSDFWRLLNDAGTWHTGFAVLCVDAVNEYNQGGYDPRPIQLLDALDHLLTAFRTEYPRIKFLITCRPETWRRAVDSSQERFHLDPKAYFRHGEALAWQLRRFSEDEFPGAYNKYSVTGSFKTPFDELSEPAKYHLRDPFMLTIAEVAYRGMEIPKHFDTGTLFETYLGHKDLRAYQDVLKAIVRAMFLGPGPSDAVKSTAFARDLLIEYNKELYRDLDFENRLSPGAFLLERNVIRRWETGSGVLVRFTYDRLAEYLLSLRFLEMIGEKKDKGAPEATAAVIDANLTPSQSMAVVYGALQRTLSALRDRKNYAAVLRAVAAIDARGLWLVISVLAKTAKNVDNGIEVLQDLLKQLSKRKDKSKIGFPFMDAVYRVLQDDDYRLWLDEQEKSIRNRHLKILYEYFVSAFRSSDEIESTGAILYLFFMWRSPQARFFADAKAITSLLVEEVGSLIFMATTGGGRKLFRNLTAMLVLVLPEATEDRYQEALQFARRSIRKLKVGTLGRAASVLANSMLVDYLLGMMRELPNPVGLESLDGFFAKRETLVSVAERIVKLLGQGQPPSVCSPEEFHHLAASDNGILVQLLTFVYSAGYERARSDEERGDVLSLVKDSFYRSPRSELAEYCSSLSIYHINCFGHLGSAQSMELMSMMSSEILSKREGKVNLYGKLHSFNIIGTYGRALHLHPTTTSELVTDKWKMDFAFKALDQACATKNAAYYLYICESLGLLGTLIEPRYLFSVFTRVLEDVRARDDQSEREPLPFTKKEIDAAKNQILQSLANIRVLHRQQVDKYLLEMLESPELYAQVVNDRTPNFRISFFFSWSFEQLMFRCLVDHYDGLGKELLDALSESMHCETSAEAARAFLARLFKHVTERWG